jgi:methionyl-tRNA formyltransferase
MDKISIIASTKSWNKRLPEQLSNETDFKFGLISSPADLSIEKLIKLDPRYIFFPHWSHIIPEDVFENFECVIFHMTDLPFGRGGSPLQNLISQGIYETQISALKCVAEVDAGPIYLKRPLSLRGAAEDIYLRASDVIEEMIVEIIKTNPNPIEQTGEPTYFKRRKPEQGNLLATGTLEQAFDFIRMLDAEGYPSAFIDAGEFHMDFTRASLKADSIIADVKITLQRKNRESSK